MSEPGQMRASEADRERVGELDRVHAELRYRGHNSHGGRRGRHARREIP
jgi:hypothetical protein